ncbi:MAG: sugar transporter ATP-binding protein [Bacilli bacterium]|nr:sugar transporter ATP-binding protein [Bacilli bacterium]
MNQRQVRFLMDLLSYLVLTTGAVVILIPWVWMLSTALKDNNQVFQIPPVWIPHPFVWNNFWDSMTQPGLPFGLFLSNSVIITVAATVGSLLSSSIVAFAFSRINWTGRNVLFFIVLATMMIPSEITIVPRFIMFKMLGWNDTFLPLIVPAFLGSPFYIFILRQFMLTISMEYDLAAKLDGCNTWSILWKIILPQCVPVFMTVSIFSIQAHWNDFMSPLIYLSSTSNFTATLGLSMFNGEYSTNWTLLMAASIIVMLPILILFAAAQKYFIQGIVTTGLK